MHSVPQYFLLLVLGISSLLLISSCDESNQGSASTTSAILLLIDEESIDNGNPPNDFTDVQVNDQVATIGLRDPLVIGCCQSEIIDLFTGEVGDEGWFALKTIPTSWDSAGPNSNGILNFLEAGPGLGSPDIDDNRETFLDDIPNVTPLRATGLSMLVDSVILAVVYDSDISVNYDSLTGNLKGANLGIFAFKVLEVTPRIDGSDSSLPQVKVETINPSSLLTVPIHLFDNAPMPASSSEPFDTGN